MELEREASGTWYLPYVYESGAAAFASPSFASWVTFLLLYNTLWPISLYVALEICKVRDVTRTRPSLVRHSSVTHPFCADETVLM